MAEQAAARPPYPGESTTQWFIAAVLQNGTSTDMLARVRLKEDATIGRQGEV
jgi:hypothetical protein